MIRTPVSPPTVTKVLHSRAALCALPQQRHRGHTKVAGWVGRLGAARLAQGRHGGSGLEAPAEPCAFLTVSSMASACESSRDPGPVSAPEGALPHCPTR